MLFTAQDVKSYQYVLICKAGLATSEKREMNLKEIAGPRY
jgi:hypothetical protein